MSTSADRRVPIGAIFPQTEIGEDVGAIRAFAQAVQDLGYEHLTAFDHVLGADPAAHTGWRGPYTHESQFHEPFVLYGYLAAVAPRLAPVTGVIVLPQRQAALVAKQAAQVDLLSGGRLRLGVGIGWNAVEYEALEMRFTNRARRFEEQIALMRELWKAPVVTFRGKYHTVNAAGINPLPVQRPIPVWIGGSAEPALKRAAEISDGYMPQRPLEGSWDATLERMRAWREAAGRTWESFGIDARIMAGSGTSEEWRRAYDEWLARGATHITVSSLGGGLRGPDAHVARLTEALDALR